MSTSTLSLLSMVVLARLLSGFTPGLNLLTVLGAAVTNGRTIGVMTALGVAFGGFVWTALALTGGSVLFAKFPIAALGLKLVGSAIFLWLGFQAIYGAIRNGSAARLDISGKAATIRTEWQGFRTGLAVTLTNPKAAMFYGTFFTTIVPTDASAPLLVLIAILSGTAGVVPHSITALVFSTGPVLRFYRRSIRPISIGLGVVFCALGVSIGYETLITVPT